MIKPESPTTKKGRRRKPWASFIRHGTLGNGLRFALGLPKARNPVSFFPLPPLLEQLDSLKTFQDIPFSTQSGRCAQTAML